MSMLPARGDAVVQERPAVRELAAAARCNTRRDRHHQVPGVGLSARVSVSIRESTPAVYAAAFERSRR